MGPWCPRMDVSGALHTQDGCCGVPAGLGWMSVGPYEPQDGCFGVLECSGWVLWGPSVPKMDISGSLVPQDGCCGVSAYRGWMLWGPCIPQERALQAVGCHRVPEHPKKGVPGARGSRTPCVPQEGQCRRWAAVGLCVPQGITGSMGTLGRGSRGAMGSGLPHGRGCACTKKGVTGNGGVPGRVSQGLECPEVCV